MISFSVLGPLTVRVAGEEIPIAGAMPGRVLALLLSQWGRPLAVDVMADQLWQGSPPRTARKSIQVAIHRLRRLPAMHERIVLSAHGYALSLDDDECDALRFQAEVARARALLRDGRPEAADPVFAQALDRWHGPAFCGVDDVELVAMERERLTELRLAAFEDHTDIELDLGRHGSVLAELTRTVAAHPYRERPRGQLMLALYRCGRPAQALAEYRNARERLVAELGVEPGTALQDLHRRMLSRDPTLAALAPRPAESISKSDFLPRSAPGFTGRRDELTWLDELASGRSATAVVSAVAGMAGIGKTALALTWAHRRVDWFPDGLFYVHLRGGEAGPLTTREALHHLLTCLGVPVSDLPASLEDAAARYRALLSGRRALVLVDDAQTADQVRPLLPGAQECFVIVTSRSSLAGLVARDGARQLTLRPLSRTDAMALLRQLAGGVRVDAEQDAAERLVDICAGIPLALRIAAAHLTGEPSTNVGDYVSRLVVEGAVATLAVDDDEHHGVKAVFDASFEALASSPRSVFRILGTIPGSDFTRDAVAATADVSVEEAGAALDALAGMHLVEQTRPGRFAVHGLLREYSRVLLREAGIAASVPLDRLLAVYRHVATTALELVRPGLVLLAADNRRVGPIDLSVPDSISSATAWLREEHSNLAAAISAAAVHGMADHVQALVDPLWQLCHHYGQIGLWISTFEGVLADIRRSNGGEATYPVLNALGNAYVMAAQYDAAIAAHAECIRAWTRAGRDVDAARARTNLAASLERVARYPRAMAELRRALRTFRRVGATSHQAYVLNLMALVHQRRGELAQARDRLKEAIDLLREVDMKTDLARALNALADVCLDLRMLAEASAHAEEAALLARHSQNRHIEAMTMTTLASIMRALGRYDESLELSHKAHATLSAMGMDGSQCENHLQIAQTYAASGRLDQARQEYQLAQSMAVELGEQHLRARSLLGMGRCLHQTDPAGAAAHLAEALAIFEKLGLPEAEDARDELVKLSHGNGGGNATDATSTRAGVPD